MKHQIFILFAFLSIVSCKKESQLEKEIAQIDIDFTVERFDKAFGSATVSDLPKLKSAFPFMFSEKYSDSYWAEKIQDTLQQQLHKESARVFDNFSSEKEEIKKLFKHLRYYYPEFQTPRVITTTSNVDYRNKVIVTDTIVLISIDTYLGSDHEFYQGIQKYLRKNFNKSQITVDLAKAYAEKYTYQQERKTLLDEMIYHGKLLYFKDVMLPNTTDAEKIGYTNEELRWAFENEDYIWRYFIEHELLYSTNSKLPNRFINPAPFSKFYLEQIDSESPGKIGQYIGWQIVKAYVDNNDISLKDLLSKDAKDILNNANFKPHKQ
ncbi:gliding motility lipoprotein GldB [Corallibacter sp.]|uniref:gliding motility lipoprotein GldB n=1 Tax=Corallibacter sp. TaxID=2038084 RepID=UPI003AB652F9